MELSYAPPVQPRNVATYVIAFGFLTTLLTLVGFHFWQENVKTDIMSVTVKFIIPVGALGVGFAAGLGYGIASYVYGVRVRRTLLWTVVLIQFAAYFMAQFIEFKAKGPLVDPDTGNAISFVQYYHLTTVNMVWIEDKSTVRPFQPEQEPERLGYKGYFYRVLGIVGFLSGGLIPPLIALANPYCELCQRFMKTRKLMSLPATADIGMFRRSSKLKLDTPEHREVMDNCLASLQSARDLILAGDVDGFRSIADAQRRATKKVALIGRLSVTNCRQCGEGELIATIVAGPKANKTPTREVFRVPLTPEIARSLYQKQ